MEEKLEAMMNLLVFLAENYKSSSRENFEELSELKKSMVETFNKKNG